MPRLAVNLSADQLNEPGLVETLSGEGPFTVFARTDDAFNKLPEGTVANLLGEAIARIHSNSSVSSLFV